MSREWPSHLPVVQVRMARPTDRLDRVLAFYRDGLGLPLIYSYMDDREYDGVMFGLPSRHFNLEFTRHAGDGPCPAPSPDSLLVLYMLDGAAIAATVERLGAMRYRPVPPRNSYWAELGVTIPDPDGWHIVLMHTHGFGPDVE